MPHDAANPEASFLYAVPMRDALHVQPIRRPARLRSRPGNLPMPLGVLFVHTATQPPLGADTWVQAQIISSLDKSQNDVHVACAFGTPDAPTPTYEIIRATPHITIVPVDFGRERHSVHSRNPLRTVAAVMPSMMSFVRLVAHARRHHISVIHTTDRPRDAMASVVLARLTGARCVIHAHVGFDPAWMNRMLQWSMKRADGMIAISEFVASTLTEISRDPSNVHVVLNAIDISNWVPGRGRDERRAEFGFAPTDTVITTVCRLFPGKGLTELVRSFARVHAEQPDTRLLVVGGEMVHGYLGELQTLASELGVADRIVFAGRRDDVPALMAASDIYAMPSMFEPFGLVYLEAMAMQLPVVALNNGGTPEVVDDGRAGLLSEPGDVGQLADNLMALVVDPARRARFGRYGREQVESRFTLDRMARDTAAVYRMLVFHEHAAALGREARVDT